MPVYKFDDCAECKFRRRPVVCADCDSGEQFEDSTVRSLNFSDNAMYFRSDKQPDTDDYDDDYDDREFDPDDLIDRLSEEEEIQENE